jgi:hypothetical protein
MGWRLGEGVVLEKRGDTMQFGMFYEIQVPKPWHENKEFDTYQQVLGSIERFAKHVMPHFK